MSQEDAGRRGFLAEGRVREEGEGWERARAGYRLPAASEECFDG